MTSPVRHVFEVAPDHAGQRLDRFLAERPELVETHISRTRVKALVEEGRVAIDGAPARAVSAKVAAGATVAVEIPPAAPAEPAPENIPLNVVFEDDHLIVIDKPAGLVVHPAAGHESGTLVNALIAHCGASLSGIGGVKRPGIVHRLDKDTSGLLVVAKTDRAHRKLTALFADHGRSMPFLREYLAIVWGAPDRKTGFVDAAIGRHQTQREKMTVVHGDKGKAAVTHWRVLETFGADKTGKPVASLVACQLETGRTHQIRVHMAHIGHPLVGDPAYATGFRTKEKLLPEAARAAIAALGRQALHAARLEFPHPVSGDDLAFESPAPADFAKVLAALAETQAER
ncbi:MAG: RluA family pseudouridine synthase [Methylobacteriaceae bacterium]|nr:RluA family pseudouridine synthase [Methylobacteriaceae bacterium]MCC0006406.1 RluA family pseudouridine synthase [Methylobacteriaceae bacterium]